ncbi:AI-2E family transporter [Corynebacterium mendelii]|uniref:AI-2E family transporter n=1 Tax=Corynebacterium mendelii TaxID=2765362 RepID=A0A939IZ01_9CORY|nr:AI-2E family transporter [Corynebacterium mendelii]MBN9645202.1 AI-2E family transporter [Corynebacterium mendelii]
MSENKAENGADRAPEGTMSSPLTDAVEGASPAAPTISVTADQPIDRGLIIGRDGRWVAGWALRLIVIGFAAFMVWNILDKLWTGLLPVLLAILVSTVFWPPVRWLRDHKVPATLAVVIVLISGFGILGGIFGAMAPRVADQSTLLYKQALEGVDRLQQWIENGPLNINADQINAVAQDAAVKLQEQAANIATGVAAGLSTASSVAVTTALMLVLTFFFLKDGHKFLPWVRKNAGNNVGWHLTEVLTRTWNTLSGYIRAQAAVGLLDAVCIGAGLMLMGVPLAFVLAVITFFGGFIPIVGAVSAGVLSVLVALVSNGVTTAIFVLILILVVQQLEGNVFSPMLQSKAMNLHPAIVLLSVTVGGTLFGIVGAFLAVPCAATLAVWLRYHAELVSLRTGEITVDDIEIVTAQGSSTFNPSEGLMKVRDRFSSLMPAGNHQQDSDDEDGDGDGESGSSNSRADSH